MDGYIYASIEVLEPCFGGQRRQTFYTRIPRNGCEFNQFGFYDAHYLQFKGRKHQILKITEIGIHEFFESPPGVSVYGAF